VGLPSHAKFLTVEKAGWIELRKETADVGGCTSFAARIASRTYCRRTPARRRTKRSYETFQGTLLLARPALPCPALAHRNDKA
jgi:hypothetical protein